MYQLVAPNFSSATTFRRLAWNFKSAYSASSHKEHQAGAMKRVNLFTNFIATNDEGNVSVEN